MNVCLACDFFPPNLGGVEHHIYQLGVYLVRYGYKVTVLTRFRGNRLGIRFMGNGLKVYYLPVFNFLNSGTSFPSIYSNTPLLREIAHAEEIDIFHVHQATSILGMDVLMLGRSLGKPVVYTDHSLFAFNDMACVNINQVIKCFYTDVEKFITVSYIGRDNLLLRAYLNPRDMTVVPNCIDCNKFKPDLQKKEGQLNSASKEITIVSISRQSYRKGTDLLLEVIPEICLRFPDVRFLIGGDGQKKDLLDKVVGTFGLESRVTLLGAVPHGKVRDIMTDGHIYLNTSLTEAFCIAIVEAASSGLFVVSTNIGGVAEVLPDHMRILVDCTKEAIVEGVGKAIKEYDNIKHRTVRFHEEIKQAYNWDNAARKVAGVYGQLGSFDRSIYTRIRKIMTIGNGTALFYLFIVCVQYLILVLLSIVRPKNRIKREKKFDYDKYKEYLERERLNLG